MTKHYPLREVLLLRKLRILLVLLFFSISFSLQSNAQGYVKGSVAIGSTSADSLGHLLADPSGNSYFLGSVIVNTLPMTIPSAAAHTGRKSILYKFDPEGNIIWSRYLPHSATGAERTAFYAMALDNGKLFLLGSSKVTDVAVTQGGAGQGGGADIIYAQIDAGTGAILNSTYFGGSGMDDYGLAIAAKNGEVYLTYATTSSNIPVTNGTTYGGGMDRVVQKITPAGAIIYSTYTGSVGASTATASIISFAEDNGQIALGLQVDADHNFPTTNGSSHKGGTDFGVVKLNTNGSLAYRILFGTSGGETKGTVAIVSGEVYLSGHTTSNSYPTTDGTSITGSDIRHVITKFNNAGAVLYSSQQVGGTSSYDFPCMTVKDGFVYLMSSGHTGSGPVMNVTDGSTGGCYLIRLNAVNGQTVFAKKFGTIRNFLAVNASNLTVNNGKIYTVTPAHNGNYGTTTDGYARVGTGYYISVYDLDGNLVFGTLKATGTTNPRQPIITASGNYLFLGAMMQGLNINFPITKPLIGVSTSSIDLGWMSFELCPPMPTANTISPLTQAVCAGGFTQAINGNKVAFGSENMPTLLRLGVVYEQQEVVARYQWQVSNTPTGPWTNIAGLGTQQNFTPPSLSETRYYRRLVLPPLGCGDVPVSISDVSVVNVSADVSPSITASIFNTCVASPVDITATVSGGTAPYTYSWDNGIASVTNDATVTPAGNSVYTLTVTDAIGCQQKGQVIVNAYAADAGPASVSVCAGKPVRLGAPPPAGLAGVTYSWSPATGLDDPAAAQPMASPAVNTTYTLTMTIPVSGGGTCSTIDDIIVNLVDAPLTPNFAGDDKAVCKGGTLTLGTAAESGFTYNWAPGNYLSAVNTSSVTFNAGSEMPSPNPIAYTLTASKGGCAFTDQVTVAALEVNAGDDFCGPRSVGKGDLLTGISGKTYEWTVVSGTGTITGATNTAITDVSESFGGPTVYRLTVTYLGVSCSDDVTVGECGGTICPLSEIEVVSKHGCPNAAFGAVTLQAKPMVNTTNWTYTWSAVPAGGLSSNTGTSVNLTDNVHRTVTLTITSKINPNYSCSKSIEVNNPVWTLPVFTAQDHNVCGGTNIDLGAVPVAGYTYKWTEVPVGMINASNPTVAPVVSTNYIATVTEVATGCIATDTANVLIKPIPINPGADWTTCSSALITLGSPARAGYTYSWTPAVASYQNSTDATSAEPQVFVAATQDFTLRMTDTETGCFRDSTVHVVIDAGSSLPAMTNRTICRGGSVVIGLPPVSGVTYSWLPAAGLNDPTAAQPVANPSSTTTYTLTVTYYDGLGAPTCTKTGDVTVTVNAPVITMSDATYCPSLAAKFNLGTGVTVTGATSYAWSPAVSVSNPAILSPEVKVNPSVPTTYTLTARDVNGCTTSASRVISPTVAAPIAGNNTKTCVGTTLVLGHASNTDVTWTVTPAIDGTLTSPTSAQPVFAPGNGDEGQTFDFVVSKTEAGCTVTASVSVQVPGLVLPKIPVQTVCNNSSTTIGVPQQNNITYSWMPTEGLSNPNASTTMVNNITATKVYTLTAVDINGCAATQQAVVGVNPTAAPTVTVEDVVTTIGAPAAAFNPQINPGPGNYKYSWSPANTLSDPYSLNPVPQNTGIGNSTYTLTLTDDNGCTSTAQAMLRVQSINTLPVTLNAFNATPKDCGVTLHWKVQSASNFSHFVLERSVGGGAFTAVKTVWFEYARTNYSFNDAEPGNGKWSYRLKLVDLDGVTRYSQIVLADVKCNAKNNLKIYPNPVQGMLYINSSKTVKSVAVYSITGNLVIRKEFRQSAPGVVQLPVNHLIKGIYLVQVIAEDGTAQPARLIKE